MNNLDKAIKQSRESLGLTQGQLSVKSGVPRSTITALEQGTRKNPTVATILQLATALRTTPDAILQRAGLLPSQIQPSPTEQIIVHLFRNLNPMRQNCALEVLRGLHYNNGSEPMQLSLKKRDGEDFLTFLERCWPHLDDETREYVQQYLYEALEKQQGENEEGSGNRCEVTSKGGDKEAT